MVDLGPLYSRISSLLLFVAGRLQSFFGENLPFIGVYVSIFVQSVQDERLTPFLVEHPVANQAHVPSCLSIFLTTREESHSRTSRFFLSLDTSFTKTFQTWMDDLRRCRLYSNGGFVLTPSKCGYLEKICQRLQVRLGGGDTQPHEDASEEDHPRGNQFERSLPSYAAQISLFSRDIGARSPSSWADRRSSRLGHDKIEKSDSSCEMRDREVTILCDPCPSHRFYVVPDDIHSPKKDIEENPRPREDRLYCGIMGARCPISTEAGKRSAEWDGGGEGRSAPPPNNDELELVKRRLCSTMFRGEDHKKSKVDAFNGGMTRPEVFFSSFVQIITPDTVLPFS